jgi:hypothetical protein
VYNRDVDEKLTAQDHDENRQWQPRDVILVGVSLLILFAFLAFLCSGFPWMDGPGYLPGF